MALKSTGPYNTSKMARKKKSGADKDLGTTVDQRTEETSSVKKSDPVYGPTDEATLNPRRVFYKGYWIGLGGDIRTDSSRMVKEATAGQYKELAIRYPKLIQVV